MIEVLFEDQHLLAINKPAGVLVHSTPGSTASSKGPTLQDLLAKQWGHKLTLHHRLDRETSGVILCAKTPHWNKYFHDLFKERRIHKTYWALVEGLWPEFRTEIQSYISKQSGRWHSLPKGKLENFSHTEFKIIQHFSARTWLEVHPITGRTHQIRLHCKSAGHPICGDGFYGTRHPNGVPMALHARSIAFKHPESKQELIITAPLPSYWSEFWGVSPASKK